MTPPRQHASIKTRLRYAAAQRWPVWLTCFLCAAATTLVAAATHNANAHNTRDIFRRETSNIADRLKTRLETQAGVLFDAAAFIYSSEDITRDDWNTYVAATNIQRRYPGVFGLAYIKRVDTNDLSPFIQNVRRSGRPDFNVFAPADADIDDTDVHYVIQHHAPEAVNAAAIGLDIATRSWHRRAYEAAMLSGEPRLTDPIWLEQDKEGLPGVVMCYPIYQSTQPPPDPQQRRNTLRGWVGVPIGFEPVMRRTSINNDEALKLTLTDVSTGTVLFSDTNDDNTGRVTATEVITVLGKSFRLDVAKDADSLAAIATPIWPIIAFGAALTTALASLASVMLKKRTVLSQQIARIERDRLSLRRALDEHTLFSITDKRGKIIDINEGFCKISGFDRQELLGSDHRILNSGHHPRSFWKHMWQTIRSGHHWRAEVCNKAKDGSIYWVDSTNIPQFDEHGNIERFISLRFDITEKKKAEADLAASTAKNRTLAAAIERAADPMVIADCNGDVRFANPAAYEFDARFDHTPAEGNTSLLFRTGCGTDELAEQLRTCIAAGQDFSTDVDLAAADGSTLSVELAASPLYSEGDDSTPDGMLIIKRDITERRESARKLQRAKDEAEAASAAKSEFLANMSHEIRTPMTAILGYTDLLAGNELDADAETDAVRTIKANASHLLTIIDDILDVSKIEAGQMAVEIIETDPIQLVTDVIRLVQPRASGKGITLTAYADTQLPATINTDPTRLRQIIVNLLGNAIKFTEVGKVTLVVSCDPEQWLMSFRVEDSGIGMTKQQRDAIARFEPFTQADASTTRKFGGTGLGLRISNALAGLLGGGLDIESKLNVGSAFTATVATGSLADIPLLDVDFTEHSDSEPASPQQATALTSEKPLTGARIMLVEDGPDNQRLIKFQLEKAGADVSICENGDVCVKSYLSLEPSDRPHAILMDMQMPVLDGYSATSKLRNLACTTPIIALTAHTMDGDEKRCLDAGCDAFLSKPIDRAALIRTCSEFFTQAQRNAA
ncbi:MAG: CHASE domain-containing protein [Planctomycetota bacterium]